jgi:hypothetical protein
MVRVCNCPLRSFCHRKKPATSKQRVGWRSIGEDRHCRPTRRVCASPPSSQVAPEESNNVTVERAVAAFMADSRDRGNSDATLQKKATVFERRTARDPKNREALIPSQSTSLLRHCDQYAPVAASGGRIRFSAQFLAHPNSLHRSCIQRHIDSGPIVLGHSCGIDVLSRCCL